jgi:hypothetical protein
MHLAGQISIRFNRETQSTLLVRTHRQGDLVLVDFLSYDPVADPSPPPLSDPMPLYSEGENKPSTLSLSACCRIAEEHGGRLLQPSTAGKPAFQMELRVATNAANRSPLAGPNRAAARSGS